MVLERCHVRIKGISWRSIGLCTKLGLGSSHATAAISKPVTGLRPTNFMHTLHKTHISKHYGKLRLHLIHGLCGFYLCGSIFLATINTFSCSKWRKNSGKNSIACSMYTLRFRPILCQIMRGWILIQQAKKRYVKWDNAWCEPFHLSFGVRQDSVLLHICLHFIYTI